MSGGILLPLGDKQPDVAPSAFVAPGVYVIGTVYLGQESSVWYGAVLRGDTEPIQIGARTNVQDSCVLHADPGYPVIVGEGCLIGINATVLTGAEIGEGSIVAAGAVVPEGRKCSARSLVVGVPARRFGEVTEEQARDIARGVRTYIERVATHREAIQRNA